MGGPQFASGVEYENILGVKHESKSYPQCAYDQKACVSYVGIWWNLIGSNEPQHFDVSKWFLFKWTITLLAQFKPFVAFIWCLKSITSTKVVLQFGIYNSTPEIQNLVLSTHHFWQRMGIFFLSYKISLIRLNFFFQPFFWHTIFSHLNKSLELLNCLAV